MQFGQDFGHRDAIARAFGGQHHQRAERDAGGAAVDDVHRDRDLITGAGSGGGIVGAGKLGGDVDGDDVVGTFGDRLIGGDELAGARLGGGRMVGIDGEAVIELRVRDLGPFVQDLGAETHDERHDGDVEFLDEARGKVRGTVGDDPDAGHVGFS